MFGSVLGTEFGGGGGNSEFGSGFGGGGGGASYQGCMDHVVLQQIALQNQAAQSQAGIWVVAGAAGNNTHYYNADTNSWVTMTGTTTSTIGMSGGSGSLCNTTGACGTVFYNTPNCFEIDEEEYVNAKEYYDLARQRGAAFRIRTAEEKRLRGEAIQRAREEAEQRARMYNEARARAHELLLSNLSKAQRETFEKNKWFVVVGGKTKTKYRIRTDAGYAGNIEVLSWGKKIATLCCHLDGSIPAGDHFLAQKIGLTYDEERFLKIANRRAA